MWNPRFDIPDPVSMLKCFCHSRFSAKLYSLGYFEGKSGQNFVVVLHSFLSISIIHWGSTRFFRVFVLNLVYCSNDDFLPMTSILCSIFSQKMLLMLAGDVWVIHELEPWWIKMTFLLSLGWWSQISSKWFLSVIHIMLYFSVMFIQKTRQLCW